MLAQPTFHLQLKLTSCPAPTVREGCSPFSFSSSFPPSLLKAKPELGNSLAAGAAAAAVEAVAAQGGSSTCLSVCLSILCLGYNKFLHLPQCGATFLNWFPTKLTPTSGRSINIYRRRFSVEHFHLRLSFAAV